MAHPSTDRDDTGGKKEIFIPPKSAKAFVMSAGQTVRIVDVEGRQSGDFVAFRADDLSVRFSQARTRVENRSVRIAKGHMLWTNEPHPRIMFTVTDDTCGTHDLLYTPCCRYALEKRFGVSGDGCLENLAKALSPWGITAQEIPDPLNLFFSVRIDGGAMQIDDPVSQPGDHIDLRAGMDCLVAISTCSVPLPGKQSSGYQVSVVAP